MPLAINHIFLRTWDMPAMIRFFEQALELKQGARPPFAFPGAWLWSNDQSLIHLSPESNSDANQSRYLRNLQTPPTSGTSMIDHIAFSGIAYPALIDRLKQHQLDYFERTVPLTREHQVFIQGPENLRIEVQFTDINEVY